MSHFHITIFHSLFWHYKVSCQNCLESSYGTDWVTSMFYGDTWRFYIWDQFRKTYEIKSEILLTRSSLSFNFVDIMSTGGMSGSSWWCWCHQSSTNRTLISLYSVMWLASINSNLEPICVFIHQSQSIISRKASHRHKYVSAQSLLAIDEHNIHQLLTYSKDIWFIDLRWMKQINIDIVI